VNGAERDAVISRATAAKITGPACWFTAGGTPAVGTLSRRVDPATHEAGQVPLVRPS
jgi:hypothetical protein